MPDSGLGYRDAAWVAKELGVEVEAVEDLMKNHRLPGFQVADKWLVSEESLREFLVSEERRQTGVAPLGRRTPSRSSKDTARPRATRYCLFGEEIVASSSKEMLVNVIHAFAERDATFLARFSHEGGRKRRYVAREPLNLYSGRPDLAEEFKEQVAEGWWVGTNYSVTEIDAILRKACEIAGCHWGEDLIILREDESERIRRALSFVGIAADPDPHASEKHEELFAGTVLNELK